MGTIEDQIKELENEISKTKYNKATEGHIGKLKAKIAEEKAAGKTCRPHARTAGKKRGACEDRRGKRRGEMADRGNKGRGRLSFDAGGALRTGAQCLTSRLRQRPCRAGGFRNNFVRTTACNHADEAVKIGERQ